MTVVKINKQKAKKKCFIKRKLKFENYKNCLEAINLENKINHLEKSQTDTKGVKKIITEFIKNNKLISKTQQRFKSKRHHDFTEENNKIALSSNEDKRI